MAYQSIDLGTSAGDGTGDDIRTGGDKINDNFVEIYTLLGTGSALTSGISATATIVTLTAPTISGVASFADNGTAEDPVITRSNDVNTGIFFPSGDNLSVTTGGVLRTTVNSTGLIVVGDITSTGAMEPAGDTNAGDNAAIGYTSVEGLILTGQGSTNDITIKNDNDEDVLEIPTGTTNVTVVGDIITASTLQATGDTAAGDNAAIGYTTAEGLILTGQGNTSDITLKNDADAVVFTVPTGTDDILFPDNAKALWGASSDLQIYHNGTNSVIGDFGTGDLLIYGTDDVFIRGSTTSNYMARFAEEGAVTLYYNNASKFTTASGGVAVTGNVTSTGTVEPAGDTAAGDNAAIGYTSTEGLILTGQGSTNDITIKNDADADVITIATGTTVVGIPGSLDVEGAIDVNGTSNLDVVDIDGAVDMASTLQVDGAITGSSTIQGTTITATTAVVPDASDGATLGTTALEWSDLYLADGAIVGFGDDQDVTLTHVADTGLLLNAAMEIQFRDSAISIGSTADGDLSIAADDEIDITSTLIDVNGNLDVSGTLTQTGVATFAARPVFSANITVQNGGQIGSAGDLDAIAIASNGVVTFSQAPVFPDGSINIADIDLDGAAEMNADVVDADLFMIDDGANGTMKKMFASRLKAYIVENVGAEADNITGGDAAVNLSTTVGNITLDAEGNDTDIILKGTDGGVDTTFLTIDGSAAGLATFNAGITIGGNLIIPNAGNIGSASDPDAIAIASNGVVTFSQIPVLPANSIDSDYYVDGSIDLAHMSANSVDSAQYVDGSIDRVHLAADIIDGTKIANDVINSEHYAAGSIDREHLAADIVDSTKIADNAINSEHYVDGSIDLIHMSANSVDSDQYVDGSIDLIHMSANSVDSDQYVDGSIDTAHIAANQITLAKMATNSIDSDQYVDGSIDTAHYAAGSVDATAIGNDVVNSQHYAADSIDEEHIANDAVGSAELKTLSTLLIKNSAGTTLKTLYGAGA